MQAQQLRSLLDVARVPDDADRQRVQSALAAAAALVAWCEAQRLRCVSLLDQMGAAPAEVLESVGGVTPREAGIVVRRADTSTVAPLFAEALDRGQVGAGHLDELGRSMRRLTADQQRRLLDSSEELLAVAATCNADDFGRQLKRHERTITRDDGIAQLRHQQANVRLRDWVDCDDGMHVWMLRLDPLAHLKLHHRVRAATETLFHDRPPDNCPNDALERQSFLRAHALLQLVVDGQDAAAAAVPDPRDPDHRAGAGQTSSSGQRGSGPGGRAGRSGGLGRVGRPEVIVVVDARLPEAEAIIDWGVPVELPRQVLADLWGVADIHPVVVNNGVILHAPGTLNLGRSTRLANPSQRRALRALYPTCAIPGCRTRYDQCALHHILWWRHGGRTDLDNLVPLCGRHHHSVHDAGWVLQLADNRTLTVTKPDGTILTTGPPTRHAA